MRLHKAQRGGDVDMPKADAAVVSARREAAAASGANRHNRLHRVCVPLEHADNLSGRSVPQRQRAVTRGRHDHLRRSGRISAADFANRQNALLVVQRVLLDAAGGNVPHDACLVPPASDDIHRRLEDSGALHSVRVAAKHRLHRPLLGAPEDKVFIVGASDDRRLAVEEWDGGVVHRKVNESHVPLHRRPARLEHIVEAIGGVIGEAKAAGGLITARRED